jgi:hypothetical protein
MQQSTRVMARLKKNVDQQQVRKSNGAALADFRQFVRGIMGSRLVPALPILPSRTIFFSEMMPGYVLGRALFVLLHRRSCSSDQRATGQRVSAPP